MTSSELLVLVGLICTTNIGLVVYLLRREERSRQAEGLRYYMLADNALSYLKATNLEEKVRVNASKEQYDVQLAYLRDTMAKSEKQTKDQKDAAAPTWVKTESGDQIDLNELEVFT